MKVDGGYDNFAESTVRGGLMLWDGCYSSDYTVFFVGRLRRQTKSGRLATCCCRLEMGKSPPEKKNKTNCCFNADERIFDILNDFIQ